MAGSDVAAEACARLTSGAEDISDQKISEEETRPNVPDTLEESDQPAREEEEVPETDFPTDVTQIESEGKDIEIENENAEVNETVVEGSDEQEERSENTPVNVAESQGSDEPEDLEAAIEGKETGLVEEEMELSEGQERTSELNGDHHDSRLLQLPMSRIKHIIKMDPDVTIASQEAVVIITRATELFINEIARDACHKTIQGRRRTVMRRDLDHVMDIRDCYAFLEGAVDD